jgi:membrane protein implicated in regulation of membrane protease activity
VSATANIYIALAVAIVATLAAVMAWRRATRPRHPSARATGQGGAPYRTVRARTPVPAERGGVKLSDRDHQMFLLLATHLTTRRASWWLRRLNRRPQR